MFEDEKDTFISFLKKGLLLLVVFDNNRERGLVGEQSSRICMVAAEMKVQVLSRTGKTTRWNRTITCNVGTYLFMFGFLMVNQWLFASGPLVLTLNSK